MTASMSLFLAMKLRTIPITSTIQIAKLKLGISIVPSLITYIPILFTPGENAPITKLLRLLFPEEPLIRLDDNAIRKTPPSTPLSTVSSVSVSSATNTSFTIPIFGTMGSKVTSSPELNTIQIFPYTFTSRTILKLSCSEILR